MADLVKKCSCSQPYGWSIGTPNKISKEYLSSITKELWYLFEGWIFHTLMKEVKAIVKSESLTVETISEPQNLPPLSPSNLLIMKSRVIIPLPGSFVRPDLYNKRQWRKFKLTRERQRKTTFTWHILVQMEEIIPVHILQTGSKWTTEKKNFKITNIVLIQTDPAQDSWPMRKILKINKDENNVVQSVKLLISEKMSRFTSHIFEWAISKLILPIDAENDIWFANELFWVLLLL